MKTLILITLLAPAAILLSAFAGMATADEQPERERLQKTFQAGNYKDAYDGFRKIALDPKSDPRQVLQDMQMAVQALQQLNRVSEIDAFLEAVIEAHKKNWRLLENAAQTYMSIQHFGFIVAGKFERGQHRGGGSLVNALERDRVRALQLMVEAMPLARQDDNRSDVARFFLALSEMLLNNRSYDEAWRLQYLTDLATLPDYETGWGYYQPSRGAPVGEDGKPVYHQVPKSFEAAASDGERWRWCLMQATEVDPNLRDDIRMKFAEFLHHQFGVQTLAEYGWAFGRADTDDTQKNESGTYALHTLGEGETIAKLATGINRFDLPDEFNFIKIYQQVAEEAKLENDRVNAISMLASIFENRRQYPKAADYWRRAIAAAINPNQKAEFQNRLDQIIQNWGRFEPVSTQPAGQGATVEYRFRNGKSVQFTANAIRVKKLLDDVKAYIQSRPQQLDWQKVNLNDIGYRLIHENQKQYVGEEVASWKLDLEPRENHYDNRVTVSTPLKTPGAYLLTAKMADGNTSYIVLWVADTTIVKKPLDQKTLYYVADAASGKPVARANVEFFGWRQEWRQGTRTYDLHLKQFAEFTNADGQVAPNPQDLQPNYQWLIIAHGPQDRLAYLGFTGVWYQRRHDAEYNATRVFTITDRPVYRPKQTVNFKFWVRHAKYDQEDTSDFAGRSFTVQINNPKGEKILEKNFTADEFGGIESTYDLPEDATLGVYNLVVVNQGGGQFRVEEYKKPEYDVTVDAPSEPVMLGERIEAKIKAKYYFGSPVTEAKVKYKIMRTSYTERWYPIGPWDWLYGKGYWWFAYDYTWYPGWQSWGCPRPHPFWWPVRHAPPELVAEREVEIGPDGEVKVEIDTAVAKAIHGDQDHRYEITAEVVDQSRRTIVGQGTVLVARKPFKVCVWVDRGYYRVGDTIQTHAAGRTLDGKPVQGNGTLTVFDISYKDNKPVEKAVYTTDLNTNVEGQAHVQFRAARSGQYRLAYKLTDPKGHAIEGAYIFTVMGQDTNGADFRFNSLELVPDKKDYQPGEKVKLQINTDRPGSTVLLFLRPSNGVYLPPQTLRLDGKSTVYEIDVSKKDMPNFFVEAITVADGRVYTEAKEIVVPPEKRVLNVEIKPSSESYRPGQKAQVKLKLTDFEGKPFVGSTVVAIYDKSVEYIAGGSNVQDIKEFFWKWRRHHHPQGENNVDRGSGNIDPPNKPGMQDLGVFGHSVVDELAEAEQVTRLGAGAGFGGGMAMPRRGMAMAEGAMPAPAAPMAASMPADAASRTDGMMFEAKAEKQMNAAADKPGDGGGGAPMVQPTIRKEFADTALWMAALKTDAEGQADVELSMPENLTTWRIKVWGMGHGTKVGEGATDVVTRKDLILRMQAPRFFVQKDEVVLSAIVHNYLKTKKKVQVALELDGNCLGAMNAVDWEVSPGVRKWVKAYTGSPPEVQSVEVPSNGEARIDWRVKVLEEGEAVVRMKALTDEESDAMEQKFPAYVHGMLKMEARSGVIPPDGTSGTMTFTVPAERRPEQTRLEIRYSPTLAGSMVDALPYLVEYPYGCTEQTLNRFLPTVITQKVLINMGLDLKEIQKKRTNLNAQEIGDDQERAKQWKRFDRNPVFDEDEVQRMVKQGVQTLTQMQLSDGGWGWFSGFGEHSSPHTTATVVRGLLIAQQNDVAIVPDVLQRGVAWLKKYEEEQVERIKNGMKDPKKDPWKSHADDTDALVHMVLVDAGINNKEMHEFLYRDRTKLAVYGLSMVGLACEKLGDKEKLAMILQNIRQYLVEDKENQTAWLNLPETRFWWCWYESEYEAMAYYLKLLSRTEPKGETARGLVKYLLNNRKHATYWNSTRDTALVVEAFAEYLKASGEAKPEMTVEVVYDGKVQKGIEITPATLFTFDNKFVLEGKSVADGEHKVELRKKGQGPLYFNGYLANFTLEDPIGKAGLEIKVERKYYRLKKVEKTVKAVGARGQAVDQKVEKYERAPLENLATLKSGELVEIELEIASKNDYEYIVFEDMKPAGFEPVELRSGYTGNEMGAYVEFRDNRVAMFVQRLARGNHSVSYRMRAEIPGKFSALPTKAWAMYAPELKANSDELKLQVTD